MNNGVRIRMDGWSDKEDEVLVSIVLSYVKQNKTQLLAFEQAAYRLDRTNAACGFRWNSYLRKLDSVKRRFEKARHEGRVGAGKVRSYAVKRDEAESIQRSYKDYFGEQGASKALEVDTGDYGKAVSETLSKLPVTVQTTHPKVERISVDEYAKLLEIGAANAKKDETLRESLMRIAEGIVDTLVKKNTDYGDSFYNVYKVHGDVSSAIRLTDKIGRLNTLASGKTALVDEAIEDVYLDTAGYSILSLYAKERLKREEE